MQGTFSPSPPILFQLTRLHRVSPGLFHSMYWRGVTRCQRRNSSHILIFLCGQDCEGSHPRRAATDPLFNGTLFFVQVVFNLSARTISISNADMAVAVQCAANASRPISAHAIQYGSSALGFRPNGLQFSANVPSGRYNDQTLQHWVNTILTQNGLTAASSCIVILNPRGVTNTDGDISLGILGYHR
jgi:hypothetical protein